MNVIQNLKRSMVSALTFFYWMHRKKSAKHDGGDFSSGVLALAAHLLRLSLWATEGNGGANRNVASESAGELSVGYAAPTITGTDADYQLTAYGQEYLRLCKLVGIGVMVA